jgi:vitamin-K-epoxide reductase (warfarin-sensitive)
MRWLIAVIALVGVIDSALALREHYRTDTSPCSINDKWDCGLVNHSPYAVFGGVPVAVIGIAGYIFLAALALAKKRLALLLAAVVGLAFSLYLTRIEARILLVWCIYCVISLGIILLITVLAFIHWLACVLRDRRANMTA